MRYLRVIILVFLCISACKKKEDHSGLPKLPAFSCDNAADDGKFEAWDSDVRAYLFPTGDGNSYIVRDTMATGYIRSLDMLTTNMPTSAATLGFQAVYDTGRNWFWEFQLVDNSSGNREAFGSLYKRGGISNDTVTEHVQLSGGSGITRGCKRLYYYGASQTYKDTTRSASAFGGYANFDILFKGHYDLIFN